METFSSCSEAWKVRYIEYLIKNKAEIVSKNGRTLLEHAKLWTKEKELARDIIYSKVNNNSYYYELSKEAATWEKARKDILSYLKKITMQEEESNYIEQMPADQPVIEERSKRSIRGDEKKAKGNNCHR